MNIILSWNDLEKARPPLHVTRSADYGKTCSRPLMLKSEPGELFYPSVFQASDPKFSVVYT